MKRSPSIGHSPSRTSSFAIVFCASTSALVGGRAADEDRLAVAEANDDTALIGGSRRRRRANRRRAERGFCESVHGVSSSVGGGGATQLRLDVLIVRNGVRAVPQKRDPGVRLVGMAESWRVVMICTIQPIADALGGALHDLGHEPVAVLAARRGRTTSRRRSSR